MVFPLNHILNVSPNLQIAIYLKDYSSLPYFFSMMLKNISFSLTVPRPTSIWEKDFSLQSPEFYSCIQFENQKKIGLLILLNCEPASLTVFATMCSKDQQTSDNLIVKDYCFIIEIFDKFGFSGILRGCLRHFN